jgi:hypothetical protein
MSNKAKSTTERILDRRIAILRLDHYWPVSESPYFCDNKLKPPMRINTKELTNSATKWRNHHFLTALAPALESNAKGLPAISWRRVTTWSKPTADLKSVTTDPVIAPEIARSTPEVSMIDMVRISAYKPAFLQDLVTATQYAVDNPRAIEQLSGWNNLAPGTCREGLADNLRVEMVCAVNLKILRGRQPYVPQPNKSN